VPSLKRNLFKGVTTKIYVLSVDTYGYEICTDRVKFFVWKRHPPKA